MLLLLLVLMLMLRLVLRLVLVLAVGRAVPCLYFSLTRGNEHYHNILFISSTLYTSLQC